VTFYCDGIASKNVLTVTVTTSIARIRIINQIAPKILYEHGEATQNELSMIYQAVDKNENGVPGKTPTIQLVKNSIINSYLV
jgi:hypothetical protein